MLSNIFIVFPLDSFSRLCWWLVAYSDPYPHVRVSSSTGGRQACKNLNARSTLGINSCHRREHKKILLLTFLVEPKPPMSVASDPVESWHLSVKPPDSNIQDSNIYIFLCTVQCVEILVLSIVS